MKKIKFKYRDAYTRGKWNEQECIVDCLKECIEIYGLGIDCDYEIISIKDC